MSHENIAGSRCPGSGSVAVNPVTDAPATTQRIIRRAIPSRAEDLTHPFDLESYAYNWAYYPDVEQTFLVNGETWKVRNSRVAMPFMAGKEDRERAANRERVARNSTYSVGHDRSYGAVNAGLFSPR